MKNTFLKVVAVTPRMKVADPIYNAAEIVRLIEEHPDAGLLVFPELCISGYTCGDLFLSDRLIDACMDALESLAEHTAGLKLTAVVGLPFRHGSELYNTAAVLSGGRVAAIVPKTRIKAHGGICESRWFTGGERITGQSVWMMGKEVPFGTDILLHDPESGILTGIEIGEALRLPDMTGAAAALAGAEVIVSLSASEEYIGKAEERKTAVLQQSRNCCCAYVRSSAGMEESSTDLVFTGHDLIAVNGKCPAESNGKETALCGVIDLAGIRYERRKEGMSRNWESGRYRFIRTTIQPLGGYGEKSVDELSALLLKEAYHVARRPFVASAEEIKKTAEQALDLQARGLARRLDSIPLKKMVIGVSGGLDSTWALLVCKKVCRYIPDVEIIGVTMPSTGATSSRTLQNSIDLMNALEIDPVVLPIKEMTDVHLTGIGHGTDYLGQNDVTYENAQARIRTMNLMDIANMKGGLVVGTGDLSELALGWCTYNGDHMSMYGVNGSLPKTLLRAMTKACAESTENDALRAVLTDILDTPVSPELIPDHTTDEVRQKTEEQVGPYDWNDFFLYHFLNEAASPEKILTLALTAYPEIGKEELKEAEKRFFRRFFSQQFKRSCMPDGPKAGMFSLSPRGGWVMPSDASNTLWLKQLEEI